MPFIPSTQRGGGATALGASAGGKAPSPEKKSTGHSDGGKKSFCKFSAVGVYAGEGCATTWYYLSFFYK